MFMIELFGKLYKIRIVVTILVAAITIPSIAQQVYVTAGTASSYYHRTSKCNQIRKSDGALFSVSVRQAKLIGKIECKTCFSSDAASSTKAIQHVSKINVKGQVELAKTARGRADQIIKHIGYTTSYNSNWLIPNWVAYELTPSKVAGTVSRPKRSFEPDPFVKGKSATHGDYSKSGFSRGHMAPAADMKWSENAMNESFYLSNICPQKAELNGGVWERLENRVRSLASEGNIYICCGPIMSSSPQRIGENKVAVPMKFFKVLCMYRKGKWQAIGFVFPNSACKGSMFDYAVSVDDIEKQTGHDFFYIVPDDVEKIIESTYTIKDWQ